MAAIMSRAYALFRVILSCGLKTWHSYLGDRLACVISVSARCIIGSVLGFMHGRANVRTKATFVWPKSEQCAFPRPPRKVKIVKSLGSLRILQRETLKAPTHSTALRAIERQCDHYQKLPIQFASQFVRAVIYLVPMLHPVICMTFHTIFRHL